MESPLSIVSGYWSVKNKHDLKYLEWFKSSLQIQCPYVFFGNKESIELIKTYRGTLPTYYIELAIEDFYTYKFKNIFKIDRSHCPSAELNMIWNEKIFLIEKASKINPFNSTHFAWIDAGICTYRTKTPPSIPFPNISKLNKLPLDKFIFTSSDRPYFEPKLLSKYYHYVSGTYLLNIHIISSFINLYKEYLDKLVTPNNIYTDQVILTHIYKDHPELFYKLGHGYGELVPLLY